MHSAYIGASPKILFAEYLDKMQIPISKYANL